MAMCAVKGCDKQAKGGNKGMCRRHYTIAASEELEAALVVPVALAAVVDDRMLPPVMAVAPAVVGVDEIRSSDYAAFLRQLLDAKCEEFLADLNSAPNPRVRAERYLDMCEAAEGLGY
ncbi:MAG: hypothetical protein PHN84_12810 [Desulfuromonadaceae bacterium]|nr:hypothetical protein [Desulfuromonadaceae bacterium]